MNAIRNIAMKMWIAIMAEVNMYAMLAFVIDIPILSEFM